MKRAILVVLSVTVALAIAESIACTMVPREPSDIFGPGLDMTWFRKTSGFTIDPLMGFRPILPSERYSRFGTLHNEWSLSKRPGVKRLIFLGDSATARGRLISALADCCGDERFEYWNAGVESFNTAQELAYYERYNRQIEPDHIILTIHNNDLSSTPVAFRDENGEFVVYSAGAPVSRFHANFYESCALYRLWLKVTLANESGDGSDAIRAAESALARFASNADKRNVQFTVILLPLMKAYADWTPEERRAHSIFLEILGGLKIRHYDLLPRLETAIKNGIDCQETPGDVAHPGDAVCRVFAEELSEKGILDPK